mgnify:CR=1 FL=1
MINHKQIIQQKTEPQNTSVIWEDTSKNYPLLKTFRDGKWQTFTNELTKETIDSINKSIPIIIQAAIPDLEVEKSEHLKDLAIINKEELKDILLNNKENQPIFLSLHKEINNTYLYHLLYKPDNSNYDTLHYYTYDNDYYYHVLINLNENNFNIYGEYIKRPVIKATIDSEYNITTTTPPYSLLETILDNFLNSPIRDEVYISTNIVSRLGRNGHNFFIKSNFHSSAWINNSYANYYVAESEHFTLGINTNCYLSGEIHSSMDDEDSRTTFKLIIGNDIAISPKQELFNDLWNEAAGEYGKYNRETGYYELNGLKDITYEQALTIYNERPSAGGYSKISKGRTNLPLNLGKYRAFVVQLQDFASGNENITIVKFKDNEILSFGKYSFRNIINLARIEGSIQLYDNIQTYCFLSSVKISYIRFIVMGNYSVQLQWCPLLSYDSVKYIVDNYKNTAAVTFTVHPNTYSYLTGTAEPIADVGGTSDEWKAILTAATAKKISFATTS